MTAPVQAKYQRKRDDTENNDDDWLMTYGDAVTLLMTFLVLMLSVSTIDQSKFESVVDAVKEHALDSDKQYVAPFEALKSKLDRVTETHNLQDSMEVTKDARGVTVELASSSLYPAGSAHIQETIVPALNAVVDTIKSFDYLDYQLEVEGHTDDVAIHTLRYPSNWELSVHRATNIVKYLTAHGIDQEKLKAAGYADTRPKVPNLDENGNPIPENRAANRRIVIHITRDADAADKKNKQKQTKEKKSLEEVEIGQGVSIKRDASEPMTIQR